MVVKVMKDSNLSILIQQDDDEHDGEFDVFTTMMEDEDETSSNPS